MCDIESTIKSVEELSAKIDELKKATPERESPFEKYEREDLTSGHDTGTIDGVINRLMESMPPDQLQKLKEMEERELIMLHFGFALHIRNRFMHNAKNGERLLKEVYKYHGFYGLGLSWNKSPITDDELIPAEPDYASGVIIERMWRRLNGLPEREVS